jgi:hypothetical protein
MHGKKAIDSECCQQLFKGGRGGVGPLYVHRPGTHTTAFISPS